MRITFITDSRGVPIAIDAFGKGIEFNEKKDGQFECTVRVPKFDMKLFAMQHCGFVQVITPKELAEEIQSDLKQALEKYSTGS